MYYEVLVNDLTLGTFGHPDVRNLDLSVMVTAEGPQVFVNAVCAEAGDLWFYDWLQHKIVATDVVTFRQSAETSSAEPRNKYKMRNNVPTDRGQVP